MVAYLIVDAEQFDDERALEYRALAEASIYQYGGRYLVMGAEPEALAGTWPASRRMTVLEFPDKARLEQWHASPEYTAAAEIRKTAIDVRMVIADGIPG
ncbi:DUF1330 domain-containing protein [Nocardia sp. KC 131]|uniref:DUF1330 domain-containing protein n=1 Tax=Nocardia arseniciresistens TaxID=3392119 RepID=UPI00398E8F86